jgi:hypothetical protein
MFNILRPAFNFLPVIKYYNRNNNYRVYKGFGLVEKKTLKHLGTFNKWQHLKFPSDQSVLSSHNCWPLLTLRSWSHLRSLRGYFGLALLWFYWKQFYIAQSNENYKINQVVRLNHSKLRKMIVSWPILITFEVSRIFCGLLDY